MFTLFIIPKLIKNYFFINLRIGEKRVSCLVDTGADVTVIPEKLYKDTGEKIIIQTSTRLISACGNPLKVIAKGAITLLTEAWEKIRITPLIIEGGPEYIILGIDAIKKYPKLIIDCMKKEGIWPKKECAMIRNIMEITEVERIEEEYKDMFKTEISELSVCKEGTHKIDTGDARPVFQKGQRIPIHFEKEIDEEIKKNLRLGIIQRSASEWCSRIVPVKKADGSLRMCIDFREVNKVTIKDRYPIPRIDGILDALTGAKFFSTLDATSGYYQIAIREEDKSKTAFSWKGGLYEFNRMPFGLCNAPATFQRTMDKILETERGTFVLPYLDDIIIYSRTIEEHKEHVNIVLKKLREAGISLNKSKCKFNKKEIKILGTIISKDKIKPDPEKIRAIKEFPSPKTIRELRSFLGMINGCREYIKDYANTLRPLFDLLKGEKKDSSKKIVLEKKEQRSFSKIKELVSGGLERTIPDPNLKFILTTDASDTGIGAILSQIDKQNKEHVISTFSKNLDKTQEAYSTTDKELLGLIKGIENYRHYLLGAEFIVRTDHKALAYLWEAKNPCSRLLRWSLKLQEYSFKVEYIKGELNGADALSRANIQRIKIEGGQIIEEPETRTKILEEYHLAAGHGTAKTMKYLLDGKYKWINMSKDIDKYVSECKVCTLFGNERINTKNRIITAGPEDGLWEIDLIGRIPTRGTSKFVFVAINHYSKWTEAMVIPRKTDTNIIKGIEKLIIARHETPKRIITDAGKEFTSKKVQEFAKKNGIRWEFASPDHHKTVGGVERVNQTLWRKIKKLCEYGKTSWEKVVKKQL